jgi:hypothetical protein
VSDEINWTLDGDDADDAYCEGDDEHLATVDLGRLPELQSRMIAVGDDKQAALEFYGELAGGGQ